MKTGKKEIPAEQTDLKKAKKSRARKIVYWLAIDVLVAVIVFALLLYRPGRYNPMQPEIDPAEDGRVSRYLTNVLMPEVYNQSQLNKPFVLEITEEGLNDIISNGNWPYENDGVLIYAPAAVFNPDTVVLMGTVNLQDIEFIVTVEIKPVIDQQGLLNLQVSQLKVGAMDLTFFARAMAQKMYNDRLEAFPVDTTTLQSMIVASLLNEKPFEPVFKINGRSIIIEEVTVEQGRLLARLGPYQQRRQ